MRSWVAIEGDFSDTVGSGKGGCDFEVEVELDWRLVVSTEQQEHKERARPQSDAHATCESPRGERQGGAAGAGRGGQDHLDQRAGWLTILVMGQCVASGRQGKALALTGGQPGRPGSVGMDCESRSYSQDDIREEEEEEGIYAGRDLVLAQTSRALQTIVSAERSRKRRERAKLSWVERRQSWILRSQDAWIPGDREAWTAVCSEDQSEVFIQQPKSSLIDTKGRMDRVPAYRYGSQEDEEEDEDDEDDEGENPCDLNYQTAYRYCDRNNQFLVKEVVKKPGCETFEIDFGDGLVSKARKPSQLRRGAGRGGRGLIRRGRGGGGGDVGGRSTSSTQSRGRGRGIQVRGIQRVSSFKRKHSFRKISSSNVVPTAAAAKTKDDLHPGSASRRSCLLRTSGGRPSILTKPSILAKPAALGKPASGLVVKPTSLGKGSVLASPGLVASSRSSLGKASSPSALASTRGRGGRGRGMTLRGICF